eukprot:gene8914-6250_t
MFFPSLSLFFPPNQLLLEVDRFETFFCFFFFVFVFVYNKKYAKTTKNKQQLPIQPIRTQTNHAKLDEIHACTTYVVQESDEVHMALALVDISSLPLLLCLSSLSPMLYWFICAFPCSLPGVCSPSLNLKAPAIFFFFPMQTDNLVGLYCNHQTPTPLSNMALPQTWRSFSRFNGHHQIKVTRRRKKGCAINPPKKAPPPLTVSELTGPCAARSLRKGSQAYRFFWMHLSGSLEIFVDERLRLDSIFDDVRPDRLTTVFDRCPTGAQKHWWYSILSFVNYSGAYSATLLTSSGMQFASSVPVVALLVLGPAERGLSVAQETVQLPGEQRKQKRKRKKQRHRTAHDTYPIACYRSVRQDIRTVQLISSYSYSNSLSNRVWEIGESSSFTPYLFEDFLALAYARQQESHEVHRAEVELPWCSAPIRCLRDTLQAYQQHRSASEGKREDGGLEYREGDEGAGLSVRGECGVPHIESILQPPSAARRLPQQDEAEESRRGGSIPSGAPALPWSSTLVLQVLSVENIAQPKVDRFRTLLRAGTSGAGGGAPNGGREGQAEEEDLVESTLDACRMIADQSETGRAGGGAAISSPARRCLKLLLTDGFDCIWAVERPPPAAVPSTGSVVDGGGPLFPAGVPIGSKVAVRLLPDAEDAAIYTDLAARLRADDVPTATSFSLWETAARLLLLGGGRGECRRTSPAVSHGILRLDGRNATLLGGGVPALQAYWEHVAEAVVQHWSGRPCPPASTSTPFELLHTAEKAVDQPHFDPPRATPPQTTAPASEASITMAIPPSHHPPCIPLHPNAAAPPPYISITTWMVRMLEYAAADVQSGASSSSRSPSHTRLRRPSPSMAAPADPARGAAPSLCFRARGFICDVLSDLALNHPSEQPHDARPPENKHVQYSLHVLLADPDAHTADTPTMADISSLESLSATYSPPETPQANSWRSLLPKDWDIAGGVIPVDLGNQLLEELLDGIPAPAFQSASGLLPHLVKVVEALQEQQHDLQADAAVWDALNELMMQQGMAVNAFPAHLGSLFPAVPDHFLISGSTETAAQERERAAEMRRFFEAQAHHLEVWVEKAITELGSRLETFGLQEFTLLWAPIPHSSSEGGGGSDTGGTGSALLRHGALTVIAATPIQLHKHTCHLPATPRGTHRPPFLSLPLSLHLVRIFLPPWPCRGPQSYQRNLCDAKEGGRGQGRGQASSSFQKEKKRYSLLHLGTAHAKSECDPSPSGVVNELDLTAFMCSFFFSSVFFFNISVKYDSYYFILSMLNYTRRSSRLIQFMTTRLCGTEVAQRAAATAAWCSSGRRTSVPGGCLRLSAVLRRPAAGRWLPAAVSGGKHRVYFDFCMRHPGWAQQESAATADEPQPLVRIVVDLFARDCPVAVRNFEALCTGDADPLRGEETDPSARGPQDTRAPPSRTMFDGLSSFLEHASDATASNAMLTADATTGNPPGKEDELAAAAAATSCVRLVPQLTYRGTTLHRIHRGYLLQGGDLHSSKGVDQLSIYGDTTFDAPEEVERSAAILLKQQNPMGLVGTAASAPHLHGSQFFFLTTSNPADVKHLAGNCILLGQVPSSCWDYLLRIEKEMPVQAGGELMDGAEVRIEDCGPL